MFKNKKVFIRSNTKLMRELTITIPDQADDYRIKMLIAASLSENDLLNSEQAAELAGVSRRVFLE